MRMSFFASLSWWAYIFILVAIIAVLLLGTLLVIELVTYGQGFSNAKFFTAFDHATASTAIAALITGITTIFAVAAAFVAGYYAKKQLEVGQRIARNDFLLRLDEAFLEYKDIGAKLLAGGSWHRASGGPKSPDERFAVTRYMGLFERIQALREEDLIEIETVDKLYGDRLFNIVINEVIYEDRLKKHPEGWRDFIKLWTDLEQVRKDSSKRWLPEPRPSPNGLLSKS